LLELVGRYRIQEQIGEGAMADVYRAYDPHISRPLAIKVLKAEYRQDREYAVRFLREAQAAGALSHPGIVTVFDVGEIDGYPFIVMELLDGEPLSEVMKRGAVTPAETMHIGVQLADALHYAHAQGVVHRDVKPSNIILSPDRKTIKLLDFGIARVAEADPLFERESLKTQIGQIVGTPRYMSPEQAMGRDLDGRSDIFSVGVVLYELASGQRAFPGASAATLTAQIAHADPAPLSEIAPETPRGLQFIIQKAMAKQPAMRFADGRRLADALRLELSVSKAVSAEAAARRSYLPLQVRLTLILALITSIVLAIAVGTVLVRQRQAMEQVALTAGSAVSAFVANNAALRAADNATLPPDRQDWVPVEAFVQSASTDPNVRHIIVADAGGIVRAATDPALVGKPYRAATGEPIVARRGMIQISTTGSRSYRFVRPILYAGQGFGKVDVGVSKAELESALNLSKWMLLLLAVVTIGAVAGGTFLTARLLAQPIRRLRSALLEVARGNLDFRISHHRRDEFGELFDGVNMVAQSMEERLNSAEALLMEEVVQTPGPASVALSTSPVTGPSAVVPDRPVPPLPPQEDDPLSGTQIAMPADATGPRVEPPAAQPVLVVQAQSEPEPEPEPEPEAVASPSAKTWPHDEDEDHTLVGPGDYR
jgi:serine/threonine-protein kinase